MARLTNTAIKNAKPKNKPYKLSDSDSLYLKVYPTGKKVWKYDYAINKKRGTYTYGNFNEISLLEAREKHLEARKLVSQGINPTFAKKAKYESIPTFGELCDTWLAKQNYRDITRQEKVQRIQTNLYPQLKDKPIDKITKLELNSILQSIAARGAKETARRMAGVLCSVFDEAEVLGHIEDNIAINLRRLLPVPPKTKNFAHITDPLELAGLIKQFDDPIKFRSPIVRNALRLSALLILRPRNIRFLKWEHIDFKSKMITFPDDDMKKGREHKVPLSNQAINILNEMQEITGSLEYVFVTRRSKSPSGEFKPLSESTTTNAIRRLTNPATGQPYGTGFMTSHGFRHTASTLLNEQGYSADAIELQLAHDYDNKIRATYNKAELLPQRIQMMQDWANYLDNLKNHCSLKHLKRTTYYAN